MCDEEVNKYDIFKEIIDRRNNAQAIPISAGQDIGPNGQVNPNKTILSWVICFDFIDGSTEWIPIKDVKNNNPIKLSEYAAANKIYQSESSRFLQ